MSYTCFKLYGIWSIFNTICLKKIFLPQLTSKLAITNVVSSEWKLNGQSDSDVFGGKNVNHRLVWTLSQFSIPGTSSSIQETMDLMKNKPLFEALTAENLFTLIMSMIYSNSSKQDSHRQGGGYKSTFVSKTWPLWPATFAGCWLFQDVATSNKNLSLWCSWWEGCTKAELLNN